MALDKLIIVLLAVVLFLGGCVPSNQAPAYMVLVTSQAPVMRGRCTGFAVDPIHVVTAAHCISGQQRVVTMSGQERNVQAAYKSFLIDGAVLVLDGPLYLPHYAQLAEPRSGPTSRVYGLCPYFMAGTPRFATYQGRIAGVLPLGLFALDKWNVFGMTGDQDNRVCGGDSGGFVVQQGKVVGLFVAIASESWFFTIGRTFYTFSPGDVANMLEELAYFEQRSNPSILIESPETEF